MQVRNLIVAFITLLLTQIFISGCALERRTTYPAPRIKVISPPPPPLEEITLKYSSGQKISGWFSETTPSNDSTPVLLYLHGNGENLQTMLSAKLFGELAGLRIHFLAIDYPGYGNSTGIPSEKSLVEAADSAFNWISRNFQLNPKFLCGWSMGAAVAAQTALKHQALIDGVILINGWTVLDSVIANRYPKWMVDKLLSDHFNTLSIIPSIEVPALIMSGEFDRIVPSNHGKTLAASSPQLKKWVLVKGCGHNDVLLNRRVWQEIQVFLENPEIDWTKRE